MSLGVKVVHAMHREDPDREGRRPFTCVSCGRAFAYDRIACPACGGRVTERDDDRA